MRRRERTARPKPAPLVQVKGLYRGMSSPLAGVAAINAITFGVYGNVLRRMEDPSSVTSVTMAGAAAGLVQVS